MGKQGGVTRREFLVVGTGASLCAAMGVTTHGAEGHARLNKKDRWYEYCRPYLEELNPRDDLDLPSYAREMAARAKSFKADTLVMMADDGGYPLYPSKLAPINSHLRGGDLLGMIERECRVQNLRFGLGFLGAHCNNYIAKTRPEWAMRDAAGNTYSFYEGHVICLNSPYRTYYTDLIREALERYPVDYLYVEGIYVRPQGCYCPSCREKFAASAGKSLEQALPEERLKFWTDSLTGFMAAVKETADAASPETVVVGSSYRGKWGLIGEDQEAFSGYNDMIGRENQWGYGDGRTFHAEGFDMLQLKARTGKPVVGTWWASHNVDLNYHQRSPAHARLSFMQTLAYGAAVQPHIQTVFEFEPSLMPVLTELFSCTERVRDYVFDAQLIPYIAVLDMAGADAYCNALLEDHLPFSLITAKQVEQKQLHAFRAVIVGEGIGLKESAIPELNSHIRAGGGLLCAGKISARLSDLAGIRLEGQLNSGNKELPLYYRFESDSPLWRELRGRLLSFPQPFNKVTATADCSIEARVIGLDSTRSNRDRMTTKPYPGPALAPMLVTRQAGAGRSLYLAADLATIATPGDAADADVMRVLAKAAAWAAGGQPPVVTNAPPSVELVSYSKPDRIAIFVLNNTMNQLDKAGVIRYVVPMPDIEVRVRTGLSVRSVSAATGEVPTYEFRDSWLTIRLPKLNEYEVLMVDLASK